MMFEIIYYLFRRNKCWLVFFLSGFYLFSQKVEASESTVFSGFFLLGRMHYEFESNSVASLGNISFKEKTVLDFSSQVPQSTRGQSQFFTGYLSLRSKRLGTRLFVGHSFENWIRWHRDLEVGVVQRLPSELGESGLAYLLAGNKFTVWSDPFLSNQPGIATSVKGERWRLWFDRIAGSNLYFSVSVKNQNIENELSGTALGLNLDARKLLDRNGVLSSSELLYRLSFRKNQQLLLAVQFQHNDLIGDSVSSEERRLQITHIMKLKEIEIVTNVLSGVEGYRSAHPVFSHILRKDHTIGGTCSLLYHNNSDFSGWSILLGGQYYRSRSNVAFYNQLVKGVRLALMYEF